MREELEKPDEKTTDIPEIRLLPTAPPVRKKRIHLGTAMFLSAIVLCLMWSCSYFLMGENKRQKPAETVPEQPTQSREVPERSLYKSPYGNDGLLIIDSNGRFFSGNYEELSETAGEEFPSYDSSDGLFTVSDGEYGKIYSKVGENLCSDGYSYFTGRFSSINYTGSLYQYSYTDGNGREIVSLCSLVPQCTANISFADNKYTITFDFGNGNSMELSEGNWRCSDDSLFGEYEENDGIKLRCHTSSDYSPQIFIIGSQVYIQEFVYTGNGIEMKNI